MNKATIFNQLHHNGKLLVLPNVWDPLSALLLEDLGYPAVATASASIAFANGYHDGQKIPFKNVLKNLKRIVESVNIPVSADIESGYATSNAELEENIKMLIDTGIAGINFEDSLHDKEGLVPLNDQCEKISLIKKLAGQMGTSLFINARSDVFLKSNKLTVENKMEELILRGKAYKHAGADGFYPMIVKEKAQIERVIQEVDLPVNVILLPGIPDFEVLQNMRLARISLGPGFLKIAINAMKNLGEKLLRFEGMDEIINNPVTGEYLNHLLKD